MRILDLHLRAVGPFTDLSLDLSAGNRGLHIIYGLNEAGKSSALRSPIPLFWLPNPAGRQFPPSLSVAPRGCANLQ